MHYLLEAPLWILLSCFFSVLFSSLLVELWPQAHFSSRIYPMLQGGAGKEASGSP